MKKLQCGKKPSEYNIDRAVLRDSARPSHHRRLFRRGTDTPRKHIHADDSPAPFRLDPDFLIERRLQIR